MGERKPTRMERIAELLVEELEERLRTRLGGPAPVERPRPETTLRQPRAVPPQSPFRATGPAVVGLAAAEAAAAGGDEAEGQRELGPEQEEEPVPAFTGPSHGSRMLLRLAIGLLAVIVLVNIPFTRHGRTLATAMPDTASLVVRDGLVVKEQSDPDIYVYQGGVFRWISSMDAFEHFGYTWADVHEVDDGWLDAFEVGAPLHVVLKCADSPHIYRLEGGAKRWIVDIAAFEAEGHKWEDVRFVSCDYLRDLPDGETIPPDQGPPPQP